MIETEHRLAAFISILAELSISHPKRNYASAGSVEEAWSPRLRHLILFFQGAKYAATFFCVGISVSSVGSLAQLVLTT